MVPRGLLRIVSRIAFAGIAALAGPGSAQGVAPAKGQTYHGTPSFDVDPLLEISRDGKELRDRSLGGVIPCTDGRKRFFGLTARGEAGIPIAADGSFSFTDTPGKSETDIDQEKSVTGIEQTSFTGTFISVDKATVSVTTTFRSARFNCSGTTVLTLSRAGTAGAPFRNGRLATGSYRARGRGIEIRYLRTFAPLAALERLRFSARVACTNGIRYRTTFDLSGFRISRRGVLRLAGGSSAIGGRQPRGTFRLVLAFSRKGGVYRVRGTVRLRGLVKRDGRRVNCINHKTFDGRFTSGPKNLP